MINVFPFFLGVVAGLPTSLQPCVLETPGLGRTEAKCGEVTVDGGSSGAPLSIGFAVLEASGPKTLPDPLVVLPGGPGQAATELAAMIRPALAVIQRERDIVLFDPRGTGRSHALRCDDDRDLAARLRATDDEERARLLACIAAIEHPPEGGVVFDPRSITTGTIAADLDEVRKALGIERWNLLGVSYGTRLALVYDRAFPGRARTLTLDGVVPFSMIVGQQATDDALQAIEALDARCKATRGCPSQNLVDTVKELRRSLDETPRDVTFPHPVLGTSRTLRIDGETTLAVIHQLLYSEESAALLPPMLAAAAAGDLAPLAAQLYAAERLQGSLSQPMQLSVLCAEDAPFFVNGKTGSAVAGESPFPDMRAELEKACKLWPHAKVPPSFHDDAPSSPTPALMLFGSADPITPPRGASAAKITLPNSKTVVGKGIGHNVFMRGCVPDLIRRFIDAGQVESLDASCASDLGPFPLFIDSMGPAP